MCDAKMRPAFMGALKGAIHAMEVEDEDAAREERIRRAREAGAKYEQGPIPEIPPAGLLRSLMASLG